jgi:hypothetical protein
MLRLIKCSIVVAVETRRSVAARASFCDAVNGWAAELQRMVSERGWRVVEFRKDSDAYTRVPFVNSAFLWRYSKSAGGYLDALCDPVSLQLNHILANPSLIFWGLFGSFFSRKTEMVAVVRAPA